MARTFGARRAQSPMPWWMWGILVVVALALLAGLVASFQ